MTDDELVETTSQWTCPQCGGGFPKPYVAHAKTVCPWCGKELAKMFTAGKEQQKRLQRWYNVA